MENGLLHMTYSRNLLVASPTSNIHFSHQLHIRFPLVNPLDLVLSLLSYRFRRGTCLTQVVNDVLLSANFRDGCTAQTKSINPKEIFSGASRREFSLHFKGNARRKSFSSSEDCLPSIVRTL